jgi:cyclopropane fatty-acyl-phospholipid synthase-like methyltransferase
LVKDLFSRLWVHTKDADKADVSDVYNRGNDFYGWFLCDRMLYSSGIFNSRDGDLQEAQTRKLDKVCKMLQMKEGEEHLDLGCGWGALICHASTYYGVKSTGITLS